MNFPMWQKGLTIIPGVTKSEWDTLDIIQYFTTVAKERGNPNRADN